MATTFDISNAVDTGASVTFSPEIWSLEVAAAYKSVLVMADLVRKLNHVGQVGDTINIPVPVRGNASAKADNTIVVLIAHTDANVAVLLNKHFEYSRLYEDMAKLQNVASLRQFFTDDAGYALGKQVDTDLLAEGATFGAGSVYSKAVIGSDGSTVWVQTTGGNGASISDAGMRRVIQTFDDNDVPTRDRYIVLPPIEKRKLLGLGRFTEQAFTGDAGKNSPIRNGQIGDLYGVETFVSSNLATIQSSDSSNYRPVIFFQRDSLLLAEQQRVRVQEQYKLEALGTLVTADVIYGVDTIRGGVSGDNGSGAIAIIVPA